MQQVGIQRSDPSCDSRQVCFTSHLWPPNLTSWLPRKSKRFFPRQRQNRTGTNYSLGRRKSRSGWKSSIPRERLHRPQPLSQFHPAYAQPLGAPPRGPRTSKHSSPKGTEERRTCCGCLLYRWQSPHRRTQGGNPTKDLDEAGRQARGYSFKDARKTLNNAVMLGYFDRAGDRAVQIECRGRKSVAMTPPA